MPDHPPPDPTEPLNPADLAFGEYVAACAEALAAGRPLPSPPSADLADRSAKTRTALRLLNRVKLSGGDTRPSADGAGVPVGVQLGRYQVLREVGRGGMGVVYLAHDPDLDRAVAVKVIAASGAGREKWLARFRTEGRLLGKLEHPNIVRVYKSGEADGAPLLVTEHVDGPSLHHHLGGRPMPTAATAAVLEAVARAVDYAHRSGVIHRDLKPANILLSNAECGVRNAESKQGGGSGLHSALRTPHSSRRSPASASPSRPGAART